MFALQEKSHVIDELRKDILLPWQKHKVTSDRTVLEPLKSAFANAMFPLGAVHEFLCAEPEDEAPTSGFIAGILGELMQNGGAALWISRWRTIFPPTLKFFGINPDHVIFINLKSAKDIFWCMEEALKCERVTAVVGELSELSFTQSRRLQLAVEQSGVTGFIIRARPRNLNTTACVTRWKITSLPSELPDGVPGVGFPRWNVELLKVRNGKAGYWRMDWVGGHLRDVSQVGLKIQERRKKAG